MSAPPGPHCRNRVMEWAMAGALLGIGIEQIIWPESFARSKLQFLLDILSPGALTLWCLVIGWFRALALYLNGGWPTWGARVRVLTSMGGAAVWMQMCISLVLAQIASNAPPSPSVPVFAALVFAEIYSTYRAAADVRFR